MSSFATSDNIIHPSFNNGVLDCEVTFATTDTVNTRLSLINDNDPYFVHTVCDIGGKLQFNPTFGMTGYGYVIFSYDTPVNDISSNIAITNNMWKKNGTTLTGKTLHMEILCDMYETGTTRPSEAAINASFTTASIETFRDTLYQAINDTVIRYIKTRFKENGTITGTIFEPVIHTKIPSSGSGVIYDDTSAFDSSFNMIDGKQHGRMFLLNVLNSCPVSNLRTFFSNTTSKTRYLTDTDIDVGHMVFGLKVTTSGGFKNTHENYAVGVTFI
jgi:hypothetical protein